jgi:D-serine deaminase-like pyridoxal phosphate-dependent protein
MTVAQGSASGGRFCVDGLPTPALVVDAAALERNVAAMAASSAARGMALRPHAKTHKCAEVAALQLAAGAVGLSVATLGEAEAFAGAGVGDLFVAYPLWPQADTASRLRALAAEARIAVGTDSAAALGALGAAGLAGVVTVRVEVDCGLGRSGVAPAGAGRLAARAADAGFAVDGVFTFPGHSYAPGAAGPAARDEREALEVAAASLADAGVGCAVTSGGSTPSAAGAAGPVPSELRPGVYVFNDAQQVALGTCNADEVALAALATVVSEAPGRVVLDAGSKVLGPDRPAWVEGHGLLPDLPGARVRGLWEHHAVVDVGAVDPVRRPRLGDRVAVVPNHVCTAVNLVPRLYVLDGGCVADIWALCARDANR